MCLFKTGTVGFYLQDAYVKDWIDNTMVFMGVENVDSFWDELQVLDLPSKYKECDIPQSVRLIGERNVLYMIHLACSGILGSFQK